MSNSEQDPNEMAGHDYDGITELDNLLPRWWLWLFWLCIAFGPLYLLYWDVLKIGRSPVEAYKAEMAAAVAARALAEGREPPGQYDSQTTDRDVLGKGEALFAVNCVVCHGQLGQGLVGPNLTDDFWIHGGTFIEIRKLIEDGVPAKGMIAWKEKLSRADIHATSSYLWALHGRDVSRAVPPAKPPEPEAVEVYRPADL